jgi:uncharacterized protein (TIGR02757 family)
MIKEKLDKLITENIYEINEQKLDPLLIAKKHKDEYSSLIAAIFAYGNVNAILKFLNKIDYSLTNVKLDETLYYRFQTSKDVYEFLKTLSIMKKHFSLNELFLKGYKKDNNVIDGIAEIIKTIYHINPYRSKGYEFLIGKIPNLSILIDEVHHATDSDIKLRQVVNYWNDKGNITTVIGFSGTPFLSKTDFGKPVHNEKY